MSPIGGAPEHGFFTGGGLSAEVPHLYPVALDGDPYLVDYATKTFKHVSIQLLRQQADSSNLPGEQSINPEGLWRRAQESWHHGAGQTGLDRRDSDDARFRRSKGVNVWEKWQLSLLNEVTLKRASVASNQNLIVAGARLYVVDGTAIQFTTDLTAFTPVTGLPGAAAVGIATDGYTIWTAHGASGIYSTNRGVTPAAVYATGTVSVLGYVKGRLMAANGNLLYNVLVGGGAALPAPLYPHPNVDFTWVGFAEGTGCFYAAGYSGDKSLIYRTAIRPDGSALDIPVVAGELPDGEVVRSIQGYLGFVLVGTDRGVRFAEADGQGNLVLGNLIDIGASVRCFEPQEKYVWFGWTNYDSGATGLGRIDLSVFTAPRTPAYATDLMAATQGVVGAVVTFLGGRPFVVQGSGLWAEGVNKVPVGSLESGLVTYGLPDAKIAMFLQARHLALAGSVGLALSTDSGAFVTLGTGVDAGSVETTFSANQARGGRFEILSTLTRSAAAPSSGPTLTRHTLRVYPGPDLGEVFYVPLVLYETIEVKGQEKQLPVRERLNHIRSLIRDSRLVSYQEGNDQYSVFISDYEWVPEAESEDGQFWNGICTVKLSSVAQI